MATLFTIFALLSVVFFVYDGILAPSRRMDLRHQIFVERDRLRDLKRSHSSEIGDELFDVLSQSLNSSLRLVSSISLIGLVVVNRRFSGDAELRATMDRNARLLKECPLEEVDLIEANMLDAVRQAVTVNSFGLFLWVFPLVIILVCVGWIKETVRQMLLVPAKLLHCDPFNSATATA